MKIDKIVEYDGYVQVWVKYEEDNNTVIIPDSLIIDIRE